MKKNLIIALTFASVAFVGCNGATTSATTEEAAPATVAVSETATAKQGDIVYINTDSLVRGYELFIELRAKFDANAAKVQKELENKSRSLERKVTDYQNKVQKGLITRAQAAETEQKLTTEQNQVLQYRDKVLAELQEEEQVLFNNINNDIEVFLNKYNDEKKFDLIINSNMANSAILIGNPRLDITTDVLNGMNAEYKSRPKE